jgi:hypothetical protein
VSQRRGSHRMQPGVKHSRRLASHVAVDRAYCLRGRDSRRERDASDELPVVTGRGWVRRAPRPPPRFPFADGDASHPSAPRGCGTGVPSTPAPCWVCCPGQFVLSFSRAEHRWMDSHFPAGTIIKKYTKVASYIYRLVSLLPV